MFAAKAGCYSQATCFQCTANDRGDRIRDNNPQYVPFTNGFVQYFSKSFTGVSQRFTARRTDRLRLLTTVAKKLRISLSNFGFRQPLPQTLIDIPQFFQFLNLYAFL